MTEAVRALLVQIVGTGAAISCSLGWSEKRAAAAPSPRPERQQQQQKHHRRRWQRGLHEELLEVIGDLDNLVDTLVLGKVEVVLFRNRRSDEPGYHISHTTSQHHQDPHKVTMKGNMVRTVLPRNGGP